LDVITADFCAKTPLALSRTGFGLRKTPKIAKILQKIPAKIFSKQLSRIPELPIVLNCGLLDLPALPG
jgi:hypothetical protein